MLRTASGWRLVNLTPQIREGDSNETPPIVSSSSPNHRDINKMQKKKKKKKKKKKNCICAHKVVFEWFSFTV